MEDSFKSLINNSQSTLVLLPNEPSADVVAAGLGLYLALEAAGKSTVIACDTPIRVEHNRFIGVDKITSSPGNKNLVISFKDYDLELIDKVTFDTDGNKYKLFVIPKGDAEPPKENQVEISYSGMSADLIVLVGGKTDKDFPLLKSEELAKIKVAHIGTLEVDLGGDRAISFARPASSVSEVSTSLAGEIKEINDDMATNFLTGIYEGSGNFSQGDISADTFQLVADLMRTGGKYKQAPLVDRRQFPQGSIPGEPVERPQGETTNPPRSWLTPKIYKGTSTS